MAIQYSGGPIVNTTFTASTRLSIVDNLKNQLVNANWTATGSSGDWVVTSAETPQSLQACVRLQDPGSGNCATVTVRNAGGSLIGTTGKLFVYPSGNDYRIICNPYQFFLMEDNAPTSTNRRDFAACGTPWVPTFPSITECIWSSSRCWNDATNAAFMGFREQLSHNANSTNSANYVTILNGAMYEVAATALSNDPGILSLRVGHSADFCSDSVNNYSGTKWFDSTLLMDTPYIIFAQADPTTDAGTINGVMWDSVVVEGAYNYGDTFSFDSKTWFCITHNNTASLSANNPGGTLFTRIT